MHNSTAPSTHRPHLLLGVLAFAQLIISIDYNIVYVALPGIDASLDFSDQSLQWVISAYALAFGGLLLVGGRLCDLMGTRRIYLTGLGLYAVGSALGGLATDPSWVIAARVLQGIGGALLFPSVLTLLSTRFTDEAQRNRAFAVWGTAGGAGMVLGSLLGGVLTHWFGWAAVFWVNVPLALGTIAVSLTVIAPDHERRPGRSFDIGGAVTAAAGVTLIIFALVQGPELGWLAPPVLIALGLGASLLATCAAIERRHSDPLLPQHLLRHSNLRVGAVVTFLYMASFGTVLYFLTIFFQVVRGWDALGTGLAFLVPMTGIAVGAQVGGRLVGKRGARTVMCVSALIGAIGVGVTALLLTPGMPFWVLVPSLVAAGIGQGAGWTVMFAGATQGVSMSDQGVASGIVSTSQQIGGATGLAVLVAVANAVGPRSAEGMQLALVLASVGILATALASLRFERQRQ